MDIELDGPDPQLARLIEGLADRPPETDLWPGIASRIAPRPRGVVQLRWSMALAAALALVTGTVALTLLVQRASQLTPPATEVASAPVTEAGTPHILPAGFSAATTSLTNAIDELERTVATASPALEPETRDRISRALRALDVAIAEARFQADATPTDVGAARYLTRTLQRKLDALQSVATMISRS